MMELKEEEEQDLLVNKKLGGPLNENLCSIPSSGGDNNFSLCVVSRAIAI